jgi:copper(I)-binding protein
LTARIREQSRRLPLVALTLIASGALVLTGCAAGQRAQTAIETPAVDGVGASVGAIDIRNLSIAPPVGGAAYTSAQLQGAIINNAGTADELVSVTTSAAKSVGIFDSSAAAFAASTSPSTPASTASSSAASSAATTGSTGTLAVPAGRLVSIGGGSADDPVIRLTGLTKPLQGASLISVTFTFKNAGSVTLQIAVHVPTSPVTAPTLPTSVTTAE